MGKHEEGVDQFHNKEIPITQAQPGDMLYYFSDLGGYRYGTMAERTRSMRKTQTRILRAGGTTHEIVATSKVKKAFTDPWKDKEKI